MFHGIVILLSIANSPRSARVNLSNLGDIDDTGNGASVMPCRAYYYRTPPEARKPVVLTRSNTFLRG